MTLHTLMASDAASVFANTSDFAVSSTFRPGVDDTSVSGVFTELEELESVRRAMWHCATSAATVLDGDLWIIGGDIWRTLHTDVVEGLNSCMVHKQLADSVSIKDRGWHMVSMGAQREEQGPECDGLRAQIVKTSGDLEIDEQHRRIEAAYRIYFEESPVLTNSKLIVDDRTGAQYRVIGYEDPEEFDRLFVAFCEVE